MRLVPTVVRSCRWFLVGFTLVATFAAPRLCCEPALGSSAGRPCHADGSAVPSAAACHCPAYTNAPLTVETKPLAAVASLAVLRNMTANVAMPTCRLDAGCQSSHHAPPLIQLRI